MIKNLRLPGFGDDEQPKIIRRMVAVCVSKGKNYDILFWKCTEHFKQVPTLTEEARKNGYLPIHKIFYVKHLWDAAKSIWVSIGITNRDGAIDFLRNQ